MLPLARMAPAIITLVLPIARATQMLQLSYTKLTLDCGAVPLSHKTLLLQQMSLIFILRPGLVMGTAVFGRRLRRRAQRLRRTS